MNTDEEMVKDTDELEWSLNLNDFEVSLIREIISDETLPSSVPERRYIGVYRRRSGNYGSEILVRTPEKKRLRLWLGTHQTAEEAAMAFDRAAFKYRGSNAVLNFPHLIGNNKQSPELELEGSPESSSNNHHLKSANFPAMGETETPPAASDALKRDFPAGQCKEVVSGAKVHEALPEPLPGRRYRGVKRQGRKFSADISLRNSEKKGKNKKLWLGCYNTPEEAAMAFDRAALKYRGSAAVLNFPSQHESPENTGIK